MEPISKEGWELEVKTKMRLKTIAKEFQKKCPLNDLKWRTWNDEIKMRNEEIKKARKLKKEAPSASDELKKEKLAQNQP